ncbi:uncharacterized protein CDAR_21471 [Caerostris darwini]|uniref:Gustatory receptor n=1 Tax=Caerostris darwini TaxID=1538125 RepID=A0AAV4W065_9ARAC|nr:uncharacterized protein CDAR_21471 [Caerostris darwini]
MFVSLLSYEIYTTLSEGVRRYRKSLEKLIGNSNVSSISIQKYLENFRRVVDCVEIVEAAFSRNTLSLVVSNIGAFFLMLSAIADGQTLNQPTMVLIFIIGSFCASVFEFIAVTSGAISLSREDDALKRLVIRFSEKPFLVEDSSTNNNISFPRLHCFSFLTDTIRGKSLQLTGGKMFVIKSNFILSVVGFMLTYGVLIYQFGSSN